jgi:alpha-glucosidase
MDCVLHNGVDAKIMHNAWPALWARCNYEAVEEAGKLGEILYFMRAGGHGSQKYCVSLWAGDQSVDWSRHDGISTVISGALSSGMMGNPYHHSDIGGFTSLHGNVRTKELFMRWLEMGTFSSLMRTHEGNRPKENFQYYDDVEAIEHMKKFVDIRVALKPYFRDLDIEGSKEGSGLPMQRPLVLYNESDTETFELQNEYLLGEDLLVAPVLQPDTEKIEVYIPKGRWVHFWTKKIYTQGKYMIDGPIGFIPVFFKEDSKYKDLFIAASEIGNS